MEIHLCGYNDHQDVITKGSEASTTILMMATATSQYRRTTSMLTWVLEGQARTPGTMTPNGESAMGHFPHTRLFQLMTGTKCMTTVKMTSRSSWSGSYTNPTLSRPQRHHQTMEQTMTARFPKTLTIRRRYTSDTDGQSARGGNIPADHSDASDVRFGSSTTTSSSNITTEAMALPTNLASVDSTMWLSQTPPVVRPAMSS